MTHSQLTAWKTVLNILRETANSRPNKPPNWKVLDLYDHMTEEIVENELCSWDRILPGARDTITEMFEEQITHQLTMEQHRSKLKKTLFTHVFLICLLLIILVIAVINL